MESEYSGQLIFVLNWMYFWVVEGVLFLIHSRARYMFSFTFIDVENLAVFSDMWVSKS